MCLTDKQLAIRRQHHAPGRATEKLYTQFVFHLPDHSAQIGLRYVQLFSRFVDGAVFRNTDNIFKMDDIHSFLFLNRSAGSVCHFPAGYCGAFSCYFPGRIKICV
jgi:hypothetical protein